MGRQDEIKSMIAGFVGQTNVITTPRKLIEFMDDSLAGGVFLSQLLYWSDRTKDEDGWFYKTYEEWNKEICLSEYEVRKFSKQLIQMKILETDVRRCPNGNPTVHYKVDWNVITSLFLKFLRNEPTDPTELKNLRNEPAQFKEHTYTKTTTETTVARPSNGFDIDGNSRKNPKDSPSMSRSKKLYNALSHKNKVMRRPSLGKWAATIRQFFMDTDVTGDEFDRVLDWYCSHIGDEFVPRAYSAKAFCDRFVNIRDQMEMSRKEEPMYSPKVKKTVRESDWTQEEYEAFLEAQEAPIPDKPPA